MAESVPLRFNGSVWINLDIALKRLDEVLSTQLDPLGISPIEWYILRSLYESDGQHATILARSVGRAATSFTPILDKLEGKGLIERRKDPHDRRAIDIFLTRKAKSEAIRKAIQDVVKEFDDAIAKLVQPGQLEAFTKVLQLLQTLKLD